MLPSLEGEKKYEKCIVRLFYVIFDIIFPHFSLSRSKTCLV